MGVVRLTQIDGKLPNVALMRLAHWHRERGDDVWLSRKVERGYWEPEYDVVYGSAIFDFSRERLDVFRRSFPGSVIGGTGTGAWNTVEDAVPGIGREQSYADYPECDYSIGFLHRGCRLRCKFCVVPEKEGRPFEYMTVHELWRGEPWPRKLHILDNDFFGLPTWREHVDAIVDGKFKVCLTQGINVRLISDEAANALARVKYYDSKFRDRRIYTAWDNLGDEAIFFQGIDRLADAGIPSRHVMAYMLVGYAKGETMEQVMYRYEKMRARGVMPYPMVYDRSNKELCRFQRWVVGRYAEIMPFSEFSNSGRVRAKKATGSPTLFS